MSEHITELEKKVLVTLAEYGPMSGYDFHLGGKREREGRKALMSSGAWEKIRKHLGPKGLNYIQPIPPRAGRPSQYDKRRRNLFCLTKEGMFIALLEGANPKLLIQNIESFGTSKDLALIITFADMLQNLPPELKGFMLEIFAMTKEIGAKVDLKREATEEEKELFFKFLESLVEEHPEIKNFIDAYFKMREWFKGKGEEP